MKSDIDFIPEVYEKRQLIIIILYNSRYPMYGAGAAMPV